MIRIDVEKGDESYIPKIQSWVDRVDKKWAADLKVVYLFDDLGMDIYARNLVPRHPWGRGINGLFHPEGVIVLRKRDDDGGSLKLQEFFFHEIGHLIYSKKTLEERKKFSPELLSIWNQYFKHFLRYENAEYQNDEGEIFARIYSHWMVLTSSRAKTLFDLSKMIPQAIIESLGKMFSEKY